MEISKIINKHLIKIAILVLILLTVFWRLGPHIPNFAPVSAVALVLSMTIGWRKSLAITLTIMAISDLAIGGYSGMQWTWLGFALITVFGYTIRRLQMTWRILGGALGASMIFYIVSNFGTWLSSGMYAPNIAGLVECYVMALPFIKATIVSDLFFTSILLASYEVVKGYKTERLYCNLTEPVSIYFQKVSPNQRKLVVTFAISVLTKTP